MNGQQPLEPMEALRAAIDARFARERVAGLTVTPRLRFFRINPFQAEQVEQDVRTWICISESTYPIPVETPPCCILCITVSHFPDDEGVEEQVPGLLLFMHDNGTNHVYGRGAAVYSRLDADSVDRRIAQWMIDGSVVQQDPPTTSYFDYAIMDYNHEFAMAALMDWAGHFYVAWNRSIEEGWVPQENRIRGPAREALMGLMLFWLPYFQH
ncbi:hypothetical protein NA57DRAFT_77664 [Rhizodiscina lignyota]|uniref:Uncharacterized protein n=1 Tax=Rhizodiscina lignyota TaxID=1504668 RepID=A0A9P4M7J6_9PEZI|nr:hypothetical protein NA57DRAFT_77664 [Rhizodiscina lignyota]